MYRNKRILFFVIMLMANGAFAQDAAAATPQEGSNLLAVLLVFTTIVLAFVIWGMGQALITISRQVLEKNKAAKKALSVVLLLGFSLLQLKSYAQDAAVVQAAEPNYGGLSAANFYAFVAVLIIEVAAILFLAFSIRRMYQELLPEKAVVVARESKLLQWWSVLDKKFFTKAVAVEKEQDVMLDHDYDGIRELDNALPPWWKYGFYITIVVGFIYLFHFHVSGAGKNPTEEYAAEIEKARIAKEIYEAGNKDKIDEQNVPMADAGGISTGKELFTAKCWACHGKLGEGGAGPNLTDEYWLHKGSLNDIYHSIKVGYPDKGMQSWSKEFTPKEMSYIASYIKTLKGTNPPNARAPQGDIYVEENLTDSLPVATKQ